VAAYKQLLESGRLTRIVVQHPVDLQDFPFNIALAIGDDDVDEKTNEPEGDYDERKKYVGIQYINLEDRVPVREYYLVPTCKEFTPIRSLLPVHASVGVG